MNHKHFSIAAIAFFAVGILAGCVEVPTGGHTSPDYRSLVRFINGGQGVDTISFFVNTLSGTLPPETTLVNDSLQQRVLRSFVASHYQRTQVDFSQAWEILVDGSSRATIGFGQATSYMDLPSGGRPLALRGTGTRVDTLVTRDTTVTTILDTIGRGSTVLSTATLAHNDFHADAGTIVQILDSTEVALNIPTETKSTVFLLTNTSTTTSLRNGLIRFGKMAYINSVERNTFMPPGLPDTILVRFVNGSRTAGAVQVRIGLAPQIMSLGINGVASYLAYRSYTDSTYAFLFSRTTSPSVAFDSVRIASNLNKRVTTVLMDSASAVVVKTYLDE